MFTGSQTGPPGCYTPAAMTHGWGTFSVAIALASSACGSDSAACDDPGTLESVLVGERNADALAAVATPGGAGFVVREARGDRTLLCPDCNDLDLTSCGACAHDVLTYEIGDARVELDRWFPDRGGQRIAHASAALTADGRVAVAWRRRLGAMFIAPSEGRYAVVAADGSLPAASLQLYPREPGELRLFAHPERARVLLLRDYTNYLARVGTHTRVLDLDGAPQSDWRQHGSSLAHDANAIGFRDGFAVAFSDQAADVADLDCTPCATLDECFADGVIDPGQELPSTGCWSHLDATDAGGLHAVTIADATASAPVQLRSGWRAPPQTTYTDHSAVAMATTETGFAVVAFHDGDSVRVDVGFADDAIVRQVLPVDRAPSWYGFAPGDPATVLLGYIEFDDDTVPSTTVRGAGPGCSFVVASYPGRYAVARHGGITASAWDDTGNAFAHVALHALVRP